MRPCVVKRELFVSLVSLISESAAGVFRKSGWGRGQSRLRDWGVKICEKSPAALSLKTPNRSSRSGTDSMVRTLFVMSSPTNPSPRVAARSKTPSWYIILNATPSNFGSAKNENFAPGAILAMRSIHAENSSSENTSSNDNIGVWWRTFWNPSSTSPSTRIVGESKVRKSGNWSSSVFSLCFNESSASSDISDLLSTWYA